MTDRTPARTPDHAAGYLAGQPNASTHAMAASRNGPVYGRWSRWWDLPFLLGAVATGRLTATAVQDFLAGHVISGWVQLVIAHVLLLAVGSYCAAAAAVYSISRKQI